MTHIYHGQRLADLRHEQQVHETGLGTLQADLPEAELKRRREYHNRSLQTIARQFAEEKTRLERIAARVASQFKAAAG